MNFTLLNGTVPSIQVNSNHTNSTTPIVLEFSTGTTTVPFIPIEPPVEKCNYYISQTHGSDNETFVLFKEKWYGGIPQNLAFNLVGWLVLMILFCLLRRAAGNYGRLALVRKDDQDEASKWTQLFYAPDDVTGLALTDYSDGPTFAATGNINRIAHQDYDDDGDFLADAENDTSVVAAEEALKEDQHYFAWIVKIFTLSDDKFLRKCGTDAVQYLRFQRHLIFLVLVMMVMCICVILPVNFQGELQGDNSDFGHTTISNLNGGADWLWIHAIMTVLFFPLGVLVMRRFSVGLGMTENLAEGYKTGVSSSTSSARPALYDADDEGLERNDNTGSKLDYHGKENCDITAVSRTLMISGIPSIYCTKELLQRHFQEAYPNLYPGIKDIQPAFDVSKLISLDEKRQRARKARKYCEGQVANHGAGQQMCPYPCGIVCMKFDDGCGECSTCCSKRTVDALTFYREEEHRLLNEVEREKARVKTKSIGIAFVTFATREEAKIVASDHKLGNGGGCMFFLCSLVPNWILKFFCCCGKGQPTSSLSNLLDPGKWSVRYSPHPDDIYWENLNESQHLFVIKAFFVNLFLFVILFFFTSPSYILSQLNVILNVKKIGTTLHLPEKMNDFLPTLLLWTIAALLPILVAYTDWWMGHWRRSAENLWIMRKVFFYLLFMVLILPSIGLTTLKGLIENFVRSTTIAPTNSSSNSNDTMMWECIFLPDNGAFFINYVVTSTMVGTALEFMRFSELFMYAFRMCFARSVAEYTSVRKANLYEFPFGFNYGWMLLIFALTAAYAVICPIITPFGLFYLVMKHGVDRYNLYYAYKRSKISKQIHATAVNSVIVSLLIQQLVLLFFNVIRGQKTEGGPGFSPRAIFSITMFTIFLAMFVGQIFFHLFLGFSPIQYNPTIESPQRSNKNSNTSSRRASNERLERNQNENQEQVVPSTEEVDGTELVYGEFGQFAHHTDVGITSSRDDIFQIPEDDIFGTHKLEYKRERRQPGVNFKKGTKLYLPDVLRNDVFSKGQDFYQTANNFNQPLKQNNLNGRSGEPEASFTRTDKSAGSKIDAAHTSGKYGAIDKQPKGLGKTNN